MRKLKIYLDNCCYNRPFDDQSQMKIRLESEAKLYIQAGIRSRKYSLAWSYVLNIENDNNPYEEKRNAIAPWEKIADEYCLPTDDIELAAREFMEFGLRAKDALHVACAIKTGCDYLITADKGMMNKGITKIKIINPIDFIRETEDTK
jgi:predicted nucleic acid-binding protein